MICDTCGEQINESGEGHFSNCPLYLYPVVLVGRHGDLGFSPSEQGIIIKDTVSILWGKENPATPINFETCRLQWQEFYNDTRSKGYKILLQNMPAILGAVIVSDPNPRAYSSIGVIIAEMGERKAGVVKFFRFNTIDDRENAIEGIKMVNSRAKIEIVNDLEFCVTVDPVPAFEFSHIRWF